MTDPADQARALAEKAGILWSCPDCAFTFDACHGNADGSGYSCPLCAETRLESELVAERAVRLAAEARANALEAAARDLLALKDGPRDAAYEYGKPFAWDRLRALAVVPQPEPRKPLLRPRPDASRLAATVPVGECICRAGTVNPVCWEHGGVPQEQAPTDE